jgi:PAS domain S-box-containing protein
MNGPLCGGLPLQSIDGLFMNEGTKASEALPPQEALRASEERLRLATEAAGLGIWVWYVAEDRVIWENERLYKMLGVPLDAEPVNAARFLKDYVYPDDAAAFQQAVAKTLEGGALFYFQGRFRRGDGELRWCEFTGQLVEPSEGSSQRVLGTATDITEKKQFADERERLLNAERSARTEAERASRMKDEFLATLSHELRTPLNAILGWSQILNGSDQKDPKDLADGLRTIERNARAQTQIIEDLLDMSRIIAGKVRMEVQRVDIASVLEAATASVRPAAEAKGIRLQTVLDSNAGPVSGDPNRLQQVFWNLLSNAVKFTPKGGRVQLLLERVNSNLEVTVTDTGEGITPEFLPFVFDRFRQGQAGISRRHGGLGLGLAIAKQLVDLHGGSIRVKSPGAGKGSTFIVFLPVTVLHVDPAADHHRHLVEKPQASDVPDLCEQLRGVRVLVVDDEPDARALVKRLLEDCNAVVTAAASAAEAFELVQSTGPDVLVSDIGMAGEDGHSLIRRVRQLPENEGGGTPALALTAYARTEDRVRAIRAGYQMHLTKPVESVELVTMVTSLAGKKTSH